MSLLVSAGCLLCWLPSWFHAFETRSLAFIANNKTGFVEYYAGRVNPQGIDYGERIQAARRRWVEDTIGDLGFWTSLVMFLLSLLGFVIVLHQHREKNRREIIVANLLAGYHNAWIEAGRRAEDAIARYNQLAKASERESPPWRVGASMANSGEESDDPSIYQESNFGPAPRRRRPKDSTTELRSRERVAIAEPDLLTQVRALQQQLSAKSEREKNRERELAGNSRKQPLHAPSAARIRDAAEQKR